MPCGAIVLAFAWAIVSAAADGEEAKEQAARALHTDGMRLYDVADYDGAAEAFKKEYLLTERPGLLFNIAQVYRKKGDCEQAIVFYRNYLRQKPDAEDRADVDRLIGDMEVCARARKPVPEVAAPVDPPAPAIEAPRATASTSEDRG